MKRDQVRQQEQANKVKRFRESWQRFAIAGHADEIDGMEFQRVFQSWVDADCPWPCGIFILLEANRPAPDPEGKPCT